MSIRGRDVYQGIQGKIHEVESDDRRLSGEKYSCESEITNLANEREEIYSRLALIYLPELSASLIENLRETKDAIKSIYDARQKRRKETEQLMGSSKERKKELDTTLSNLEKGLDETANKRDSLQATVGSELNGNQNYLQLRVLRDQAQKRVVQNKSRYETFKKESEEKLVAYNHDRLFRYLADRNFESRKDRLNPLARKLDQWVADIVDYKNSKKNYDFLLSVPKKMEEEVTKQERELESIVIDITSIEQEVAKKHGLDKILAKGSKLLETRKALLEEIQKEDTVFNKYTQERTDLDNNKGEYHKKALKELKNFLKGDSIKDLKEHAKATETVEDDKLVPRIEEIDKSIRGLKDKAKELQKKQGDISEKLTGLKGIEDHYKRQDYSSGRSRFNDSFDVNTLLTGYMLGSFNADYINRQMESSHHFESIPSPSYSSGSSDSGGSGGWGGFDSGGSSSGGGFDSGGMSTGGGFDS